MSERISIEGLQIAGELADFIETSVLPDTGVSPAAFWAGMSRLVTELTPENRALLQVKVEDADVTDEIFTRLMGDVVEPRREFIQDNALNVANLDV